MALPSVTMRFNSPPTWPTPPQGWTPPEGWKPDPSWPPAPADWTFWVEEPVEAPKMPLGASYNQRHGRAAFGGIVMKDGQLRKGGQVVPVQGAVARVESAGDASSRVTLTRVVGLGVFALAAKKKSGGGSFLTIEGYGFAWVLEVEAKQAMKARQFAAAVNSSS